MKNSVLEFRKNFPGKKMTEKPELEKNAYGDIIEPPLENDYGSNVDALVDSMGESPIPPIQDAHDQLMRDPKYAVATHGHQINKLTDYIEEIVTRLISLEKKVLEHEAHYNHVPIGPDLNDPLKEFPEVTQ